MFMQANEAKCGADDSWEESTLLVLGMWKPYNKVRE